MSEILYGIREDGKVVSINDIPKYMVGLACGCVCAECGRKLQACSLDGKVMPYFRHDVDHDIDGKEIVFCCSSKAANESALHKMAKQIIQEEQQLLVPPIIIHYQEAEIDPLPNEISKSIIPFMLCKERLVVAESVEIETNLGEIRPDATLKTARGEVLIEFFVSHKVSAEKAKKAEIYGSAMLEVDLSGFAKSETPVSKETIRKIIIEETALKKWIYYPLSEKSIQKAKEYYENDEKILSYRKKQAKEAKIKWYKENRRDERKKRILMLFESDNYETEVNNLRNDSEFLSKTSQLTRSFWYDFASHFSKYGSVPFFIDIPVTGEMLFKCDRRIWQSIIFNRFVYGRKENGAKFNSKNIFDVLEDDYGIPVDYDLIFPLYDKPLKEGTYYLPERVVASYIDYLEVLGFVKTDYCSCWNTVNVVHTINPPKKENSKVLEKILKTSNCLNPDSEFFVFDMLDKYWKEKQRREEEQARLEKIRQEELAKAEEERQIAEAERVKYNTGLEDVQNLDFDQNCFVVDRYRRRWVKCGCCNLIKRIFEMDSYQFGKGYCLSCKEKDSNT